MLCVTCDAAADATIREMTEQGYYTEVIAAAVKLSSGAISQRRRLQGIPIPRGLKLQPDVLAANAAASWKTTGGHQCGWPTHKDPARDMHICCRPKVSELVCAEIVSLCREHDNEGIAA